MEQTVSGKHSKVSSDLVLDKGAWKRWVIEIRVTWILVLLLTVLPSVLLGTAILSVMVLIGAVLLGIPAALIACLIIKDKICCARLCRRVVVMVMIPALTVIAVFYTDKFTPDMASPIAKAIEEFKLEAGVYPDTLAALSPKHLAKLPAVRISVIQPEVLYQVNDGRPYLAVPSTAGDAFSKYEYIFEDKRWVHYH